MRLLKPITITITEGTLTLQESDTYKIKSKVAYEVLKTMLMHSQAMTFYSVNTYEDMCALLRAVIFSNIND